MRPGLAFLAVVAAGAALVRASPSLLDKRATGCQVNFTICHPPGATATTMPPVGTSLASLYQDLLASVKGQGSFRRRDVVDDAEAGGTGRHASYLTGRSNPGLCCT